MADLFDIVTARKLSGGGGGSSDFSTATMTVVSQQGYPVDLCVACIVRGFLVGKINGFRDASADITVVLYNNDTTLFITNNIESRPITISGAIEDLGDSVYSITGDCTITIS